MSGRNHRRGRRRQRAEIGGRSRAGGRGATLAVAGGPRRGRRRKRARIVFAAAPRRVVVVAFVANVRRAGRGRRRLVYRTVMTVRPVPRRRAAAARRSVSSRATWGRVQSFPRITTGPVDRTRSPGDVTSIATRAVAAVHHRHPHHVRDAFSHVLRLGLRSRL